MEALQKTALCALHARFACFYLFIFFICTSTTCTLKTAVERFLSKYWSFGGVIHVFRRSLCSMTTFCITFNIAILCVVQSLYLSNDIYYYSRLTENKVCFNAKQNVALLQTSTRTLQWGPLTLSRENLHPLAT